MAFELVTSFETGSQGFKFSQFVLPLMMFYPETVSPELLKIFKSLMLESEFGDFLLGGGTSLALRFGHRRSIDLDFFSDKYGNAGRFLAVRSLAWFEDAESEPDPFILNGWVWKDVRKRIEYLVEGIIQ